MCVWVCVCVGEILYKLRKQEVANCMQGTMLLLKGRSEIVQIKVLSTSSFLATVRYTSLAFVSVQSDKHGHLYSAPDLII